jgi:tRNA(Ile)-lysidine synthase
LRGEESDRDERLAADFAASLEIPFFKIDFDTLAVAGERKISIEMAARDLRYEWFEQLRRKTNAAAIAVAHHQDDSIETLLLNLIRGTGINGLTGIKPKNGFVVRPLLGVSKDDILHYAQEKAIPYIVDSSNLEQEFTRNKIRLQVLPLLQLLNPGVNSALLRTMGHLNEVSKIYCAHIKEAKEKVFDALNLSIHISTLLDYPSPESILFEILKEYGFGETVVKEVYLALEGQSGKEFYSDKYHLRKDRNELFLVPRKQKEMPVVYYIGSDEREITFPVSMNMSIQEKTNDLEIIKDRKIAYFDADQLNFPLVLRKWQIGDRFVPFGMNGNQKLSDYFNDHKFTQSEKENTWILCSGKEIIWIVGHRTDNRFRITKNTKRIRIYKLL